MLDSTHGLTVTEVAESAGLSPYTLHYHERIGLHEQSPVAAAATVAYGESDHQVDCVLRRHFGRGGRAVLQLQTRGVGAVSSRRPNAGGTASPVFSDQETVTTRKRPANMPFVHL